jgi:DNA-binding NtrC family response regulator
MPNRILIVDDEPLNLDLLDQELAEMGHVTERAIDGSEALAKLDTVNPDLVLLDYQMPGMNGIGVLREIRRRDKNLPVVIITAYGTIERAVEAVKAGANDFITKPFDPEHLALVVKKALERAQLQSEVEFFAEELGGRYRLVAGKNAFMVQTIDEAKKAAGSKSTVLLLGESGTGKEIFARAIHDWSDRRLKPFIAINCVGLAKELLESELFGHEKGAFTGAHQLKKGKMELADGGTVFLDEVGDIAPELQTKLLRFLQEREFERVGGTEPITVDLRIIAATNRDLDQSVKIRTFRGSLPSPECHRDYAAPFARAKGGYPDPGELLLATVLVGSEKEFLGNRREHARKALGLPLAGKRTRACQCYRTGSCSRRRPDSGSPPSSGQGHRRATDEQD